MKQIELSIIVPVYNVESYLAECLNSLLEQLLDHETIEIIAINDGSTDGSLAILERYAARYANIKVYNYENSGLGAVRNKGINLARGKYISFVDSDDIIPKNAFYTMLRTLKETGSQIVTGPVQRFENGNYTRSGLHKKVKFAPINQVTINAYPTLIYDTTSTNKMYNLAFLKKHDITFPENIAYEDMLFTLKAFCLSEAIDVIDTVVYIWRIRSGESISISQNRFIIQSFEDRLSTLEEMVGFTESLGDKTIRGLLVAKIMAFDLPLFSPNYDQTPQEFIDYYIARIPKLIATLKPDPQFNRLNDYRIQTVYNAVFNDDREVLMNYSLDHVETIKIDFKQGNEIIIQDDFLPEVYQQQLDFSQRLPLITETYDVDYRNDHLKISGAVISKKLNLHNDGLKLKAYLEKFGKEDNSHELKIESGKKITDGKTLNVIVPLKLLESPLERYNVRIVCQYGSYSGSALLSNPRTGISRSSLTYKTMEQAYLAKYNFGWDLELSREPIKFYIKGLKIENDQLILAGDFPTTDYYFALYNSGSENVYSVVKDNQLVFDLKQLQKGLRYNFSVVFKGSLSEAFRFDKLERYFFRSDTEFRPFEEYTVRLFTSHGISIGREAKTATLTQVNFEKASKIVKLRFDCPVIGLIGELSKVMINIQSTNGRYSFDFPAKLVDKQEIVSEVSMANFIPYGNYRVFAKLTKLNGKELTAQVLDTERIVEKQASHTMDKHRITLFRRVVGKLLGKQPLMAKRITNKVSNRNVSILMKDGHQVFIDIQPKFAWFEKTPVERERNKEFFYPLFRKLKINRKVIVFDSYWSEQFSCSPKALYNVQQSLYPEMKSVWTFLDENMPITGNGIRVKRRSLKYWYYLARAGFIVHNSNMPTDYEKRFGQKELFIPHGSFMKVMGYDTPEIKLATAQYRQEFDKRIGNWDSVSVPSDYMAEKIQSAFNFEGEIIKEGLPRNTQIYKSLQKVEQIKHQLELDPTKKIVLYAPTWRESKETDLKIDLELLQRKLTDTIILVRLHYFVSRAIDVSEYSPFVVDVSNHQDIEELYAISDVLITDYSSVMFDFAYTEKPMIFYCYDLEHYQNSERGTYLDYAEVVPGLIARETADMVSALSNLEEYQKDYQTKYQQFYETFCQYGKDEASSQRLLTHFLGK